MRTQSKYPSLLIGIAIAASCVPIVFAEENSADSHAKPGLDNIGTQTIPAFIHALAAGKTQVVVNYGAGVGYDWENPVRAELVSRFGTRCQLFKGVIADIRNTVLALSDFQRDLKLLNPDAVIWDCSYYDALREKDPQIGLSPAKARADLLKIVQTMRKRDPPGETILMIGYPMAPKTLKDAPNFEAFAQMYRDLAAEEHLVLVDCAAKAKSQDNLDRYIVKGFREWYWPGPDWIANIVVPQIKESFGLNAIPIQAAEPSQPVQPPVNAGDGGPLFLASLRAGKPQLLVTMGTSLTYGSRWAEELAKRCTQLYPGRLLIKDAGAPAMDSRWGLAIAKTVAELRPDAVTIEYAVNDASAKIGVDQARAHLDKIIEIIKAANPRCDFILQTMDACTGKPAEMRPQLADYYQLYRDYARDHHYVLVDHYVSWKKELDGNPEGYKLLVPDGVHPNAAAQVKIMMPDFEQVLFAKDAAHASP